MPWPQHSSRVNPLPKDWHARRAACYRNAAGRCQWTTNGTRCNTHTPLHKTPTQPGGHADHINRNAGDDQSNLQWLCPPHHAQKTSNEGHQAATHTRTKAQHPREQHPATTTNPRPGPR